MTDWSEPVDELHAESTAFCEGMRRRLEHVRWAIAAWEPRPCPPRPASVVIVETSPITPEELNRLRGWFRT